MSPRDTRTGGVLEQMILPALRLGRYEFETQAVVGVRPSGRQHRVDVLATKQEELSILISLKWQQVSGTAEQKVPYEIISLADIILNNPDKYKTAYLVLGGTNWTLRDYYLSGDLKKHLIYSGLINVISLEDFIVKANSSLL